MEIHSLKSALEQIYRAALEAVDPARAVASFLRRAGSRLTIGDQVYRLDKFRRVYLVGAGKAAVPMARAVEGVLADRLTGGLIVVKSGHGGTLQKTRVIEAGHPEPDGAGLEGARELLDFLQGKLSREDLLMVVISGGGSALLPAPAPKVPFEDKKETTSILLKCGATIEEMNTIRKHLSRIKGGRLIEHAQGARVAALLLSDVMGDDLTSIASGPTVPDPTTFADALKIIQRYRLEDRLPDSVLRYLRAGARGQREETPKPGDPRFRDVQNLVVGSNIIGLRAAAARARSLGFVPLILSSSLGGDTGEVAKLHAAIAREILNTGNPISPPCCLISGGETTVKVRGTGKGGRNQEFALWCALEIAGWKEPVLFASLGSDGTDGPTDAAGAQASPETVQRASQKGLSIPDHLDRNDSYHFFKELGELILTGPTQTNVMDFRFVLIGERA